jgi:hypothetical protein
MTHPDAIALLRSLSVEDPPVDEHIADCGECASARAKLAWQREKVLHPELPMLSEQAAWSMVQHAMTPAPRRTLQRMVPLAAAAVALFVATGAAAWGLGWIDPFPPTPPPEAPMEVPVVVPDMAELAPVAPSRKRTAPRAATLTEPAVEDLPGQAEQAAGHHTDAMTLFAEAAAALEAGKTVEAEVVLELLIALHPETDLAPLAHFELGLSLRMDDPAAAAAAFEQAIQSDPDGPIHRDARRWLCEVAPERCAGTPKSP